MSNQYENASRTYCDLLCRIGDDSMTVEIAINTLLREVFNIQKIPKDLPATCITIPRKLEFIAKKPNQPIFGQVWRWNHVRKIIYKSTIFLTPFPFCFSGHHQMEICLNPLHYRQRLCKKVLTTGAEVKWATLGYYEKLNKLDTFSCTAPRVQVKCNSVTANGVVFDLDTIKNESRDYDIVNARQQIGYGIVIYYLNGQVVLELLSDSDVFIHSRYHNILKIYPSKTVVRLSPYRCKMMQLMSDDEFHRLLNTEVQRGPGAVYSFAKICTIHISFAQAWNDSIPVFDSPCWLEVRLLRHLGWIDRTLQQMGAKYKLHF